MRGALTFTTRFALTFTTWFAQLLPLLKPLGDDLERPWLKEQLLKTFLGGGFPQRFAL